jgi:hypothetical protein
MYVEIISFLALLVSVFSLVVLWQAFPTGLISGLIGRRTFLELNREEWMSVHIWSSLVFAGLFIIVKIRGLFSR